MKRGEGQARGGVRGSLGLLLLANALPIAAVVVLGIAHERGEVELRSLPQEGVGLVVTLGAALVGVVALGWGAYPGLRWAHAATSHRRAAVRARAREAGLLTRLALAPALAGLALVQGFLWLDAALVALAVVGLVGVEVASLVVLGLKLRG